MTVLIFLSKEVVFLTKDDFEYEKKKSKSIMDKITLTFFLKIPAKTDMNRRNVIDIEVM